MRQNAQFGDIKKYAIGMIVEVAAICVMMLVSLVIGWLLVSWY